MPEKRYVKKRGLVFGGTTYSFSYEYWGKESFETKEEQYATHLAGLRGEIQMWSYDGKDYWWSSGFSNGRYKSFLWYADGEKEEISSLTKEDLDYIRYGTLLHSLIFWMCILVIVFLFVLSSYIN